MSQNFSSYHSGFPDLMLEKDGTLKFIEVKAEGDVLRAGQLSTIRLLKEAGFEVEVLRVKWMTDPNQVYTVLDVETTGGTSSSHRVIEVGAVKVQNGEVIDEFQTLINPGRPISGFIAQYTGITNEMVADAPAFADIAEKLSEFMEGTIFVAHNVRFDYGFIQREFARAGLEFSAPTLCTCAGLRKAYPGISSYSLKNLTEHFAIRLDNHHRALCDAKAAAELLRLMNEKRAPVAQ
jgi:DNA polymerase-3 subunit epsilon